MKNPLLFLLNSSRYCAKIIKYLIGQIEYSDLIDSRYTNKLPTIITSNKAIRELPEDDRLKDRIYETTIAIAMPEESIRSLHADRDKEAFLRSRGIA